MPEALPEVVQEAVLEVAPEVVLEVVQEVAPEAMLKLMQKTKINIKKQHKFNPVIC